MVYLEESEHIEVIIVRRQFNVTGTCIPEEDYMVDITEKLTQIKALVDNKAYFAINRGRQYGKTTTLHLLENFLNDYIVISISFEGLGTEGFSDVEIFCQSFLKQIYKALRFTNVSQTYRENWLNENIKTFSNLSDHITEMCENEKLVLMIDEVDKASNHRIFLDFLSKLRDKYLARRIKKDFTFHSIILVGVYDIRNLKLKMVQEGLHTPTATETTTYNSPWNIATDFNVDMSFSPVEIQSMLIQYENDHQTKMNIEKIAQEIYNYTSGYPVLVSRICKYIDERLEKDWTTGGVRRAVKLVLKNESPLFDTLIKNLTSNPDLSDLLYQVLMSGKKRPFNIHNPLINLCYRYDYVKDANGTLKVSNKIFEVCLMDYFTDKLIDAENKKEPHINVDESGIITGNQFNMQHCMEKFSNHLQKYHHTKDEKFIEREGRLLLLTFLSPILNGQGFVYIESQSTDGKQTDVIVNYLNQQFIIELKIWDGPKKHEKAYKQLLGYMERFDLKEGYLLTFDSRKTKKLSQNWVDFEDGKRIFDVVV